MNEPMRDPVQQFGRSCTLIVSSDAKGKIDLSELRIKFSIKRSAAMTPNVADIRIYNVSEDTATLIKKKEFSSIVLQAGYEGNYGVIFKGNIKQVILGRESATDTFVQLLAGDGDEGFNFAVVNTALAAGASHKDQLNVALKAMAEKGVESGYIFVPEGTKLPRGKVMYGMARDFIKQISDDTNSVWSIQNEQVHFLPVASYLPGEAVTLNAATGMIGTPVQTVLGVNVKCLLNPLIRVHGRVQIDNALIADYKIDFSVPGTKENTPALLSNDGLYYVYVVSYTGDTRGQEWYSDLVLLTYDPADNPYNTGLKTT